MSERMIYEICVQGALDSRWAELFSPMEIKAQKYETIIWGPIQDQAELFGALLKIRDLGMKLISINNNNINPNPFPILTTQRLMLREFCREDVPAVYEILCRDDVNQWLETARLESIEEAEERVNLRINLFNNGLGVRWAIALCEDPARLIGSCGIFSIRRGTHSVEMGYELHPDYWRRGIMTEALRAVIEFLYGSQNLLPVHRIEALVAPGNLASILLLEKLGFTQECLRRHFFIWDDRYQDVYLYALLGANKFS